MRIRAVWFFNIIVKIEKAPSRFYLFVSVTQNKPYFDDKEADWPNTINDKGHNKGNNLVYAKQRLRSACASAQSDQSFH